MTSNKKVEWVATVGSRSYNFLFRDMPPGADIGEGLDHFLDTVYYGGENEDWDADALTACCPKHWLGLPKGEVFLRPAVRANAAWIKGRARS